MSKQEANGALVNKEHMEECVKDLDVKLESLRKVIEPKLPPTVKVKSIKIDKQECHDLLNTGKTVSLEYKEKSNGDVISKKDFFKPVTKWKNTKKSKLYGINSNEEVLVKPTFSKLKEARDYAKTNYPDTPKFKYPNIEVEIEEINRNTKDFFGDNLEKTEIIGCFTKISVVDSKLSQHEKVKLYLLGLGWDTDEWTFRKDPEGNFKRAEKATKILWPKVPFMGKQLKCKIDSNEVLVSTPKVNEKSFESLPEGVGEDIKQYNTFSHRRKFIANPTDFTKGLLHNIREDGRITCGIMTFGTTAGRSSHSLWVNPPSGDVLYGKQIREIIVAEKDHTLIGIDMPSAHPRLLADFTGNETFIKAVDGKEETEDGEYVGEDFHTVNSVLFELNIQEDIDLARKNQDKDLIGKLSKGRKKGKGNSYCCLYGGSGKKVAKDLGISNQEGERRKQNFLSGLGLDILLSEIDQTWDEYTWANGSYIKVLGGYNIWCSSKHKIINYKALGSEAVLQKMAIILISRKFEEFNMNSKIILNMHDETLFEVPDNELEKAKPMITDMYKESAKYFNLTLDWSSMAKQGINYYGCH